MSVMIGQTGEPLSKSLTVSWHKTPAGMMRARWTGDRLFELKFITPSSSEADAGARVQSDSGLQLDDCLTEYFKTGRDCFSNIRLNEEGWTEFTARVYACCRTIGPGETSTYKELARLAGSPNAFRAVGAAMARNRILLIIPCHRVLASDGKLTGFNAPGGTDVKRFLLDLES
ncbi:MAG: methylated-DNA--[protein]-cysteine S-methyltransferase [Planctomycetota bacterium]